MDTAATKARQRGKQARQQKKEADVATKIQSMQRGKTGRRKAQAKKGGGGQEDGRRDGVIAVPTANE